MIGSEREQIATLAHLAIQVLEQLAKQGVRAQREVKNSEEAHEAT